jgi:hypothetical protein
MKTHSLAMRRVCVYCDEVHDMGAICPCGSATTEHLDGATYFCGGCGTVFVLPPEAAVTHGMCDAASFDSLTRYSENAIADVPQNPIGRTFWTTFFAALDFWIALYIVLQLWRMR